MNSETATEKSNITAYQSSEIKIKPEYAPMLREVISDGQDKLKIWKRIRMRGEIYTCTSAIETKSIDYFVKTKESIGKIIFFFGDLSEPKFLMQTYRIKNQNYHWTEMEPSKSYEVLSCDHIFEKMLYFKTGTIEYITKKP